MIANQPIGHFATDTDREAELSLEISIVVWFSV